MSSRTIRTFAHPLKLAATGVLLYIGAAGASESPDNLLQQQRDLLAGTPARLSAPAHAPGAAGADRSTGDAQELARRLLLGITAPPAAQLGTAHATTWERPFHGDAQQLAREVLIGYRDMPAAADF